MTVDDRYTRSAIAARLKEARTAKFSTAAEAARLLGMKEVTVRAHENGQNRLSDKNAEKYSRLYGTSPNWLLYGDDTDHPSLVEKFLRREISDLSEQRLRTPVWQDAKAGAYGVLPDYSDLTHATKFIRADVEGYGALGCNAFQVTDNHASPIYPLGTFVIVAPTAYTDVRTGDHVVVISEHPSDETLVETTVRGVHPDFATERVRFTALTSEGEVDLPPAPDGVGRRRLLGVVLGSFFKRDRSSPSFITNEALRHQHRDKNQKARLIPISVKE